MGSIFFGFIYKKACENRFKTGGIIMEWKKTSISGAELEKQQQAYIKEALEMAKRSVTAQLEKSDKKASDEKSAAEKLAAEKATAEKAAEKAAAEKAAAEKFAAEKAAAEKAAAEKAAAEQAAAEKAAAEKAAADAETTDENNAVNKCEEEMKEEELTQFLPIAEEETECEAQNDASEETVQSGEPDIIDIAQIKKENFTRETDCTQSTNNPPNFNNYINQHNKAQCGCPNCQRKRQQQ